MYSYQNEPRIGDPELRTHVGYCELALDEKLQTAEGDYFNNRGRVTANNATNRNQPAFVNRAFDILDKLFMMPCFIVASLVKWLRRYGRM